MIKELIVFEKEGFPILKVFEDYFEVKAIDFWDYRKFKYSEIKKIEYYNPNEKWWSIFFSLGGFSRFFEDSEPSILKITKTNGGTYKYKCPYEKNKVLEKLIKTVESKRILEHLPPSTTF